jgi:hypothetical protein
MTEVQSHKPRPPMSNGNRGVTTMIGTCTKVCLSLPLSRGCQDFTWAHKVFQGQGGVASWGVRESPGGQEQHTTTPLLIIAGKSKKQRSRKKAHKYTSQTWQQFVCLQWHWLSSFELALSFVFGFVVFNPSTF